MTTTRVAAATAVMALLASAGEAQEARRRWELQRQIRLDKFEQVLPVAMKNAGLDAWIVAVKENHYDPLWEDLGRGYVTGIGYYAFFLRGDRVERAGARAVRLPAEPIGRLRQLRLGRRPGQGGAQPRSEAHRRQHVRRDRPGRRPVGDDARAAEEDARRALRLAARQRRAAGLRVPIATRGRRDRRLRRGRRHRHPAGRAGAVQRGDHAGEDHARRGGVVAAGPAARARPRLGVRHAVGLRHRPRGHRRHLERPHRAARRRHHDRLGRAADELRHRRQARRLRAEAGRDASRRRASATPSPGRSPPATSSSRRSRPAAPAPRRWRRWTRRSRPPATA